MAFGVYYYVQPNYISAHDAANLVMEWIEDNEFELDLPIMLDLEDYNGSILAKNRMGTYIRTLATRLEEKHGRKCLIYTGAWWWNEHVEGDFDDFDTIQARYPRHGTAPPSEVVLWQEWAFSTGKEPRDPIGLRLYDGWQFTSDLHGPDFGVPADAATKRLDGNLIRAEAWERWSTKPLVEGEPAAEEPSDEPVDMEGWPPFRPAQGEFGLFPWGQKETLRPDGDNDHATTQYVQGVINAKATPKGVDRLKVDGKYGPITQGRVKDVQAFFEITVDAIVGWDGGTREKPGAQATWPIIDFLAGQPDSE
jgi:hypothetical protein